METLVFIAVLFAAVCHAGWNTLIKIGLDPLATTALIAAGAAAVSVLGLPLAGMPASAAGRGSSLRRSFICSISQP